MKKNFPSKNMLCLSREKHAECDHLSPEDKLKNELHYAATNGNVRQVKEALRNVGDVNSSNRLGQTALHLSCLNGHVKCVKAILKFKPDVNIKDDSDFTPLTAYLESSQCHTSDSKSIVEMLLKAGADPDSLTFHQMAPLHMAVESLDGEMQVSFVELLIDHNADVNLQGMSGNTPLHFAIYTRNHPAIDLLVRNGADIYIKNNRGVSPMELVLTEMKGDLKMLTLLGEQLIRIYCCETPVYQKHLDAVSQIPSLRTFRKQCERQARALSSYKYTGYNITYYDILISTPTKIAKYMQNSDLLPLLTKEDLFNDKTGFIFEEEYCRKILKGYKKHKAYRNVYKVLKKVLPILPDICINIIIEYIDDKDLIKMGIPTSRGQRF